MYWCSASIVDAVCNIAFHPAVLLRPRQTCVGIHGHEVVPRVRCKCRGHHVTRETYFAIISPRYCSAALAQRAGPQSSPHCVITTHIVTSMLPQTTQLVAKSCSDHFALHMMLRSLKASHRCP